MNYIRFLFVLYWFAPFLKFGPLPSKNPRCAPETPKQILSCEYCETFKNTYFEEHLPTAASGCKTFKNYLVRGLSIIKREFYNYSIMALFSRAAYYLKRLSRALKLTPLYSR